MKEIVASWLLGGKKKSQRPQDISTLRIQRHALILLILFVSGGFIFSGWGMAVSVAIGGVLSVLNLHWMVAGVDRVIYVDSGKGAGWVILQYVARLLLIFITFFAIIHTSFLSLMGALLGLSVFVLAGIFEAVLLIFRVR